MVTESNEFSELQKTGNIAGVVKDGKTGEAIPGANIFLEGTKLGAASDMHGKFNIINIPPGVYNVKATMIGYQTGIISQVKVGKDKSTTLNFNLKNLVIKVEKSDKEKKSSSPSVKIGEEIEFVPYDKAPMPEGGFLEIQKNLEYPDAARKAGLEGQVVIYVQIDKKGKILKTKIQKSLQLECDKAAIKAIKSVKWKPAMQRDKPIAVWVSVPIKFKLK